MKWLILIHVILALWVSAVTPPWEAYDETGHFANIQIILDNGQLPSAGNRTGSYFDQSHQPPPYYVLASAFAGAGRLLGNHDDVMPMPNYFAFDGTNRHGVRLFLRQPTEGFPWHGTVLSIHLARLASVLCSTLMVVLTALIARRVLPIGTFQLLAVALVALQPQALFMGAIVNNDVLVNLMSALALWCLLRCRGDKRWVAFVALGVAVGLCIDAKRTGLSVALAVGLCLAILAVIQRWKLHAFVARGAVTALCAGATIAPLLVSNLQRFGVLLPDRAPVDKLAGDLGILVPGFTTAARDGWIGGMFWNAFETFWGAFGWGNLKLTFGVYVALALMCGIAGVGLALGMWSRANRHRALHNTSPIGNMTANTLVLFGFLVAIAVLPTYRALAYQDRDLLAGRYLLPALPAIACLIALGWLRLGVGARIAPAVIAGAMLVLSVWVPAVLLPGAYVPSVATARAQADAAILTIGGRLELLEVAGKFEQIHDIVLNRDLPFVNVHTRWRVTGTFSDNLAFGVSVLGRDNRVLGTVNQFGQGGNFPSSNWHAGDVFTDDFLVELQAKDPALPALGRVSVALFPPINTTTVAEGQPHYVITAAPALPTTDSVGRSISPITGRFRIPDYARAEVQRAPDTVAQFGGIGISQALFDGIGAEGTVHAGQPITITYGAVARDSGNPEATAFVHGLDGAGRSVVGSDHAPVPGYPTDLWVAGESLTSTFVIVPPAAYRGELRIETGFYRADTQVRLPSGTPDNVVTLRTVTVIP